MLKIFPKEMLSSLTGSQWMMLHAVEDAGGVLNEGDDALAFKLGLNPSTVRRNWAILEGRFVSIERPVGPCGVSLAKVVRLNTRVPVNEIERAKAVARRRSFAYSRMMKARPVLMAERVVSWLSDRAAEFGYALTKGEGRTPSRALKSNQYIISFERNPAEKVTQLLSALMLSGCEVEPAALYA